MIELAKSNARCSIPIGYVYEDDINDFLDIFLEIKSFPTYVFFRGNGLNEIARVEGVNFVDLQSMINRETSKEMNTLTQQQN